MCAERHRLHCLRISCYDTYCLALSRECARRSSKGQTAGSRSVLLLNSVTSDDLASNAADDRSASTSTRSGPGCAREVQMQVTDAWEEWWRGLGHVARCNRDMARTREAFEAGYAAGRLTRQRAADDAAETARGAPPGAHGHETWRATRAAREST